MDFVLLQLSGKIEEMLEEGIGMEYNKFVSSTLANICAGESNLSSQNLSNYTAIIVYFPLIALDLLSVFRAVSSISHVTLV